MFGIKFRGILKDDSQLQNVNLSSGSIKIDDDNDTISKSFFKGFLLVLPIVILFAMIIKVRMNLLDVDFKWSKLFESLVTATILSCICIVPHEIMHALVYPVNAIKEIWIKPTSLCALTYCTEAITKKRFIIMCLCPNIILTGIPFILWNFGLFNFDSNISYEVVSFVLLNLIAGIGDYWNVYIVSQKVPNDAYVQINKYNGYWFMKN